MFDILSTITPMKSQLIRSAPGVFDDDANGAGVQIVYGLESVAPGRTADDLLVKHGLRMLYRIFWDSQHSPNNMGVILTRMFNSAWSGPIEIVICIYPMCKKDSLGLLLKWLE